MVILDKAVSDVTYRVKVSPAGPRVSEANAVCTNAGTFNSKCFSVNDVIRAATASDLRTKLSSHRPFVVLCFLLYFLLLIPTICSFYCLL